MATIITADQGFDETYYLSAKAAQLTASTGQTWTTASTLAAIQDAGLTPAEHYSLYGYNEGLSPNAYYNDSEYAASKAAEAGISADQLRIDWYNATGSTNLYTHYLQYGSFETGVNPSAGFDDAQYYAAKAAHDGTTAAEAEASIQAAGLNAISHYLLYGQYEGLSYTPTASTPGQTYTLTTGVDTFTGGDGNDTFDATTVGTFNSYDVLNGGGGTNTLLAQIGAAAVTTTPTTLTNIQNIQLYNSTGTLNLSNTTGVTEVGLTDGAGTVQGLHASTVTLDVTGNPTAVADTYTFQYLNSALAGATDAVTLNLTSVGDTTNDIIRIQPTSGVEGVEAITLNATGAVASYVTLGTGSATDLTTLNSTGTADLHMSTLAGFANLTTFDASTAAGAQYVTFGTQNMTVTGGSGNDSFTFGAGVESVHGGAGNDIFNFGTTFTTADTVDGDAGTNTLAWTTSTGHTALSTAEWAKVSNVQVVDFTDGDPAAALLDVNQDVSLLTGATSFSVHGDTNATAYTFTNALSTQNTFSVLHTDQTVAENVDTLSISLHDSTGTADSLTLNIGSSSDSVANNLELTTLANITGLETLHIVTNGNSASVVNTITNDNVTGEHDISGSASLTLTNVTNATKIDASALTGNLTVGATATAYAVDGGIVIGGSGNDTFVAGANAQSLSGGAGNDSITGGAGADVMSGGTGANTFHFDTNVGLGSLASTTNFDTITDWTAGSNTIADDTSALAVNTAGTTGLTVNSHGLVTSGVSDLASFITAAAAMETGGGSLVYTDGTDSYLFISDGTAGVQNTDELIKLTGVHATTGMTISSGDITAIS